MTPTFLERDSDTPNVFLARGPGWSRPKSGAKTAASAIVAPSYPADAATPLPRRGTSRRFAAPRMRRTLTLMSQTQ